MSSITVRQAQTDFLRYLDRVSQGESFVLTKDDKPVAELRPVDAHRSQRRPIGLAKGTFSIPAEFFDPLPEETVEAFEGKTR
jgi:antitoxin (DNA-binding transcriptional repressor) of toxin-antitoxin stability system